jgi:hypothetical protein
MLLLLPLIILVIGVAMMVAGSSTKEGSAAIALRVIGMFLSILSLIFIAGCLAMSHSASSIN